MPLRVDAGRKLQRSWVLLTSSGKMQADTEGRQLPSPSCLQYEETGFISLRDLTLRMPRAGTVGSSFGRKGTHRPCAFPAAVGNVSSVLRGARSAPSPGKTIL